MKNIFLRGAFVFSLAICLFSCSAPVAKDGLAFTLQNGVPVYYKNVDSTRISSVVICVKGGTLLFPRDQSGIEKELFELMSHGGWKYHYKDLTKLSYDKNIDIVSGSSYSGSSLSVSCVSNYFDLAIDALLSCFLNPLFDQTEYDNIMTECDQGIQRRSNDPESLLFYTINKEIYKDHPLGTSSIVLPESRANMTLENLKAHYKKIIDARRLFVVAAGDVNLKKLRRALEKSLAKVSAGQEEFVLPEIPQIAISGEKVSLTTPALPKASGHIALVFKSPSVFSEDLIVARLAASMYNESLFNVIRTKHGACYTPSASVGFSPAPYGMVFLYRVSDMKNAASYVPQAQKDFLQSDIEGKLNGYIKKYVNSAYQNQMTCASIAGRSASAILTFGDMDAFDKMAESAKSVSAEDIRRVFAEYFQSNDERIFEISGE
ncbi:MAG: insulinase family protein [Treponema sp.]|nr:insulinase family protein [Treponema sp.]